MKDTPYHYRMFVDGLPWYGIGSMLWIGLMAIVMAASQPEDMLGTALLLVALTPLTGLIIGWLVKGPADLVATIMDEVRGLRSRA